MEMYFKKEGMRNFAMLVYDEEITGSYQENLFQYHEVPYFLPYEVRQINGRETLCYHLKYRTTVKDVIGHLPFTLARLKNMADSIIGVMETAEDYLLDTEDILWRSENIFLEADTGFLQFCYYPVSGETSGSLKEFLMEIMQAVDKKQEEAVLFILQFYNLVTEENCTLEMLQEFRNERIDYKKWEESEEEERNNRANENIGFDYESLKASDKKEKLRKQSKEKEEQTKEKEEREKESIAHQVVKILLAGVGLLDMLLIVCLMFDILTYDYMKYLFIGLAALIILTILYMQLSKEETPEEMMQDYFEEQKNKRIETVLYAKDTANSPGKLLNEVLTEEKWGETRLLTEEEKMGYAEEVVVEEEEKQLCLRPLEERKYPKIYFDEECIVIGCMTESCNYVLEAEGISRMHAKLIPKLDGIFLLDLNSTNGTYLNGELLEGGQEYKLEEGDMVVFARCEFLVVVEY